MNDFNNLGGMLTYLVILPYIGIGVAWAFVLVYILGWVRSMRGEKDPLLGGKVIYSMLFTIGLQVLLFGVATLVPAIIKKDSGDLNGMQYMAESEQSKPLAQPLALIFSGAIIGLYGLGMVYGLSRRRVGDSQVFRQAMGLNTVVNGLICSGALIVWFMALFKDGFDMEAQIDTIWLMLIYFIGHVFCVLPVIRMIQAEATTPESAPTPPSSGDSPTAVLMKGVRSEGDESESASESESN